MIGRRTTVGLSLLCALLFSAIAVQSASAAKAQNTTAVTCVKGVPEDFSDAHCDNKVTAGTGEYGHVAIANDTTTKIEVDNSLTGGSTDPAVLAYNMFGGSFQVTCNTMSGTGELHNVLTETNKHTVTGEVTVSYTNCSVQKPAKCDVQEPIEFSASFEGFEESSNMGVNFKPVSGSTFFILNYTDNGAEQCGADGWSVSFDGSALATSAGAASNAGHSGATPDFDHTKLTGRKTLLLGGVAAGFESTGTVKHHPGGTPITLTTTT